MGGWEDMCVCEREIWEDGNVMARESGSSILGAVENCLRVFITSVFKNTD